MEDPEGRIYPMPYFILRQTVIFKTEGHLIGTVHGKKLTPRILKYRCCQLADLADTQPGGVLPNPTHFTDDGISGTRFDRPGFLAMMEEVEAGRVEAIVIKDMSRLGRDYLKVGQVMEILRQRGVRLIAINDGVDSLKGDDDFTPFRNIMNDLYARDTSRKIRSVFKSKGMSGKHLTGTVI